MFAILLLLILLRPFICSLAFPFINHIYATLLMSFLTLWCLFKGLDFEKIRSLRQPLLFFCFSLATSVAFSINLLNSTATLFAYASGLLLLIIVASLTLKEKKMIINVISLAAFVISLLAINQYVFEFSFLKRYLLIHNIKDHFILEYVSRKRVFFPFLTPNLLAGYLGLIIPFFLINKRKILLSIPLFIAFFLTQSVGALVGLVASLCVFFILQAKTENKEVFFFFIFCLTCVLIFYLRAISSGHHTQPLFSGVMRLGYWKQTLEIIKTHPVAGIGIGNFNLCGSRYAHNLYLQLWAEAGILGLCAFCWMVFRVIKQSVQGLSALKEESMFYVSALTSTIFLLIHNIFDFSFFLPEISMAWWVILGLTNLDDGKKTAHSNSDV